MRAARELTPSPLARDIAVVLVVKAAVLVVLWLACFSDPVAPGMTMDASRVERKILVPSSSPEPTHAVR